MLQASCYMKKTKFTSHKTQEIFSHKSSEVVSMIYLILHNIRSVHNVGSIFRTADAAGVAKIFLTGYTPTPLDRFKRPRKDFVKVSLGAEQTVSWEKVVSIERVITMLKQQDFFIASLEQNNTSIDYKEYKPQGSTALILGNEVDGVSQKVLDMSDSIIEIPMRGEKESLNVSVAAGIALFELLRNRVPK